LRVVDERPDADARTPPAGGALTAVLSSWLGVATYPSHAAALRVLDEPTSGQEVLRRVVGSASLLDVGASLAHAELDRDRAETKPRSHVMAAA
jgi:hypothetical protein